MKANSSAPKVTGTWARLSVATNATTLALSGLVLSGSLMLAYTRFYDELGVRPADVGFTYASVLPSAVGLAVAFAALALGAAWLAARLKKSFPALFGVLAIVFFFAVVYLQAAKVQSRVAAVRAGDPVAESRIWQFVLLSLHAEPVTVVPVDASKGLPAPLVDNHGPLLLLGQANSTVVVYDSTHEQAIYLPSGAVIVRATSCRAASTTDPANQAAFSTDCQRLKS